MKKQLKELKKGDIFQKVRKSDNKVYKDYWIKGDYSRELKKYECTRYEDINDSCYLKSNTIVCI